MLSLPLAGQSLYYDVVKGNKSVGSLIVEKKNVGTDSVEYTIDSNVAIRILFTFKVKFQAEELFVQGLLRDGEAMSTLNGRTQKDSHVSPHGKGVMVKLNGSDYNYSGEEINYSVPMLYFEEPGDRTLIFSQQFANYIPLKRSGSKYILDSPDGINYYTYENGICQEVKVIRDFATFYFKLKEVKK